jgi:hypothetical protein
MGGKIERYFSDYRGNQFNGYYKVSNPNDYYSESLLGIYFNGGTYVKYDKYDLNLIKNGEIVKQSVNKWWYTQQNWQNNTGSGTLSTTDADCNCSTVAKEYANSKLKRHHVLKTAIENNPCILNTLYEFNNGQYIPESKWMKEFNSTFGLLANLILLPAAFDAVLAPMFESLVSVLAKEGTTLIAYLSKDAAKNMAIGTFIDINLQAFLLMYFEDVPVSELAERVFWGQTVVTGMESAVNIPWVSTFIVPLYTSFRNGEITKEEYLNNYCIQAGATTLVYILTNNSTSVAVRNNLGKLTQIYRAAPAKFIQKVKTLSGMISYQGKPLLEEEQIQKIFDHLGIAKTQVDEAMRGVTVVNTVDDLFSWANNDGLANLSKTDLGIILHTVDNNIDFAQRIVLATRDIQSAVSLSELASKLKLPVNPTTGSLTPYEARVWYSWRKANIKDMVDKTKSLEEQAKQAFNMRNEIRTKAREIMKDKDIADFLNSKETNMSWEQALEKYKDNYNDIIDGSMKGRLGVDNLFKLPKNK